MFIVFKLVVILLLVLQGSEVFLPTPPSWLDENFSLMAFVNVRSEHLKKRHQYLLLILKNNLLTENYVNFSQSKMRSLNIQSHYICPLNITEKFYEVVIMGSRKKT